MSRVASPAMLSPAVPVSLAGAALAILSAQPGLAQQLPAPVQYTAEYEVRYKGRRVARAEFSVAATDDGGYVFSSSTRARGLLRLASPNPAIERSLFSVDGGTLQPTRFLYEDGSRKGEDNYSVEFDRSGGEIRISGPAGPISVPFEAGVLDRGSLQVALMQDLASCRMPDSYRYIDDEGIRQYDYQRLDDRVAETEIGDLPSLRLAQRRDGSSRETILWMSPELAFLPVRIEQIRDGEVETVFTLEDVTGLERQSPGCSGFR